jgi:hypothetical protein
LTAVGAAQSACQLAYTPSSAGSQAISGAYSGDAYRAESNGATGVLARPSNLFTLAKPKLNGKKGTATLLVTVPGPGGLVLKGQGIKRRTKSAAGAGTVKLLIKATKKTTKRLTRTGKASVAATVTYLPIGGDPRTKSKRLTLRKTG